MTTAASLPCLRLIVPPRHGEVPSGGSALYDDRVRFIARGPGLAEISTRGYEEVIDRVVELARARTPVRDLKRLVPQAW